MNEESRTVERGDILGVPTRDRCRLACERRLDGLDDGRGDVVLDVEDVGHFAVVALGPEVIAIADVHELRGDPQAVPRTPDAAFQNMLDVELSSDFANVGAAPAKLERRGSRRDAQAEQPGSAPLRARR